MANLLIENVPDEVLERLRQRAAARNRAVGAEARELLLQWLDGLPPRKPVPQAAAADAPSDDDRIGPLPRPEGAPVRFRLQGPPAPPRIVVEPDAPGDVS